MLIDGSVGGKHKDGRGVLISLHDECMRAEGVGVNAGCEPGWTRKVGTVNSAW